MIFLKPIGLIGRTITSALAVVPDPIGSDPALEIASGGLIGVDALTVTFRLTNDPAGVTVANRTVALVPLTEYTGNEQNASAWVSAAFTSQQAVNDEVTLTAGAPGTHVMVWEAREADHATNPPNPRRWSSGTVAPRRKCFWTMRLLPWASPAWWQQIQRSPSHSVQTLQAVLRPSRAMTCATV